MKRCSIGLLALPVLVTAMTSCAPNLTEEGRRAAWVERTLNAMTVEEMVSQMFIVHIGDTEAAFDPQAYEEIVSRTVSFGAGGVVLFRSDPMAQAALIHDLQVQSSIPLLVAQDMEWGAAMRVDHATEFPRAMAVAATDDPEVAFEAGRVTAEEARAVGVNLVLAPVADVNTNPQNTVIATRSFGDDPTRVARFVERFVAGVQSSGALATAKHFPGHGSTREDSHVATPVVDASRLRTDSLNLLPFREAVQAGVGAIMTGHLAISDSFGEPGLPATLSAELLQGVLRGRLGFEGLIITDALNMAGVGDLSVDSLVLAAIDAGVDLLLMAPRPDQARSTVLRAIASGEIPADRIRASVRRILSAKAELDLARRELELGAVRATLSDPLHRAAAADAARRSVTALRNNGLLPRIGRSDRVALIALTEAGGSPISADVADEIEALLDLKPVTYSLTVDEWPSSRPEMLARVARLDLVILVDLTSEYRPRARLVGEILEALAPLPGRLVHAAMGSPFGAAATVDGVDASVLTYGASGPAARAVTDAVFGLADICGKLPISLSEAYPLGFGLCIKQAMPRRGLPSEIDMQTDLIDLLDGAIEAAIADSAFPGAAVAVGREDLIPIMKAYGHYTYDRMRAVDTRSVFDLASLTKVIATTTAIMLLYEANSLDLDDAVSHYIPEFGAGGKESITIRDLLSHTGGLIPFRPFYRQEGATRDTVLLSIYADTLIYEPGTDSRYSDFGPIVLAEVVERITGQPFASWTRDHIFEPLGMRNTGFRAADSTSDPDVVPTELDDYFRNRLVQGVVHDENAYLLGGTAGHAGLFSNVEDLARFAHMIIREGRVGSERFLRPETVRLFTTPVDKDGAHSRALGWDTKSPSGYSSAGRYFGRRSFGHTGFTGTSIWFDPDQSLYVILLTNRVYPTRENSKHVAVRPDVAEIVYRALEAASPAGPARAAEPARAH